MSAIFRISYFCERGILFRSFGATSHCHIMFFLEPCSSHVMVEYFLFLVQVCEVFNKVLAGNSDFESWIFFNNLYDIATKPTEHDTIRLHPMCPAIK